MLLFQAVLLIVLKHIERTVSEVLRRMVRKYSGKYSDVIVVAIENPAAVLSGEAKEGLSGKSDVLSGEAKEGLSGKSDVLSREAKERLSGKSDVLSRLAKERLSGKSDVLSGEAKERLSGKSDVLSGEAKERLSGKSDVLSGEVKERLSGKSDDGVFIGMLSNWMKEVDRHPKGSKSNKVQVAEVNDTVTARLVPEEDAVTSSSISAHESESPLDSDSAATNFLEQSVTPSSPVDHFVDNNSEHVPLEKSTSELKVDDATGNNEDDSPSPAPKPSKRGRPSKWKPEEVENLIKLCGEMESRFQVVKLKMTLWNEVSVNLSADGVNVSPGQCKSLWASMVKKYEESKIGDAKESWPYFEEMNKILSDSKAEAETVAR